MDLRTRVLADWDGGLGAEDGRGEVPGEPGVGASLGAAAPRDRARSAPRPQTKFRPRALAGQEERLRALVTAQPDRDAGGTARGVADARRACRRSGARGSAAVDRQKKRYTPTNNAGLTSRLRGASGATWQPLRDVRQYVFLDECGVTTDLLRRYGRSPRGTRLHDHTPCSHWQTHTVIAALAPRGARRARRVRWPDRYADLSAPTSNRCWCPTLRPGRRRRARQPRRPQAAGGRGRRSSGRRAPPLPAALQSGLQSDRTGLRQTESVLPRGASAQLRPGLRA